MTKVKRGVFVEMTSEEIEQIRAPMLPTKRGERGSLTIWLVLVLIVLTLALIMA